MHARTRRDRFGGVGGNEETTYRHGRHQRAKSVFVMGVTRADRGQRAQQCRIAPGCALFTDAAQRGLLIVYRAAISLQ